ncbi:ATPase [Acetanaerobacterium elongatum]|uniref:ATPase n=1 Tax=Acetanaerobacterium elongatum TaxID=258515 RepID=A0A1G9VJD9_9FIRM|nr:ATPase [Acetanaerobacterium elongatum]SDM72203.1 hypothetical protein SAMN05192585_10422 [Acetanaerobacterium elongatum]
MSMNIDEVLDMMDELIDNSWAMPLSGGRCVIDVVKLRELMDDVRLALPNEIKQAKAIVSDRADIISDAKHEAETIVAKAEEKAKALVNANEITKQAQVRAQEIVAAAQQRSKEIRLATNEYVENIVRSTEECLAASLNDVRSIKQQMKQPQRSGM